MFYINYRNKENGTIVEAIKWKRNEESLKKIQEMLDENVTIHLIHQNTIYESLELNDGIFGNVIYPDYYFVKYSDGKNSILSDSYFETFYERI